MGSSLAMRTMVAHKETGEGDVVASYAVHARMKGLVQWGGAAVARRGRAVPCWVVEVIVWGTGVVERSCGGGVSLSCWAPGTAALSPPPSGGGDGRHLPSSSSPPPSPLSLSLLSVL